MAADDDRFERWQRVARDQLGYALNLLLTLTVAALAYEFALLRDTGFRPDPMGKALTKASLGALAAAATFGLFCVLTRLLDFRGTARRARGKPHAPSRDTLDQLGTLTWCLFYLQLITFATGILAIGVALLLTYGAKLR
jgi:hypothetical protein